MNKFKSLLIVAALAAFAMQAHAVTECSSTVMSVWTGDNGATMVSMANGTAGYVTGTNPDAKSIAAMAGVAMVSEPKRTVIMRFAATGISCAAGGLRTDVIGMYTY